MGRTWAVVEKKRKEKTRRKNKRRASRRDEGAGFSGLMKMGGKASHKPIDKLG